MTQEEARQKLKRRTKEPRKFTQSDINRAIYVAFGAGFSAGESRKFKTSIDAWEATQKAADQLRRKQLAQKGEE